MKLDRVDWDSSGNITVERGYYSVGVDVRHVRLMRGKVFAVMDDHFVSCFDWSAHPFYLVVGDKG